VGTARDVPIRSSLLIAGLASLVLAPAAHAADNAFSKFGGNYGGGVFVGDNRTASQGTTAIGIRRESRAGNVLAIRLTIVLPCRPEGGGWRGSDLSVMGKLAPDGTFSVRNKVARTTGEVGRVRVTIRGTLTPERADGTAVVRSSLRCGGQVRNWSARPIEYVSGSGNPAPPADGIVYGITGQSRQGGPHGFIALVSGGGTQVQAFTSFAERCEGRDAKGRYTATANIQEVWKAAPLDGTAFRRRDVIHETAAGRRHGIKNTVITTIDATFGQSGHLSGIISDTGDWRRGRQYQRCDSTQIPFAATP
jgi:hypothetical protein